MEKRTIYADNQITNEEQIRFSELALQARKKQDWDSAETFWNRAIEAAPQNAQTYMHRGATRCMKAKAIKDRGVYLEALKSVVSDYRKAYELNPSDDTIGVSLLEAEILGGSISDAAVHAKQLFLKINEPVYLGICCWLGALASVLDGQSDKEWTQFKKHMPLARRSNTPGVWDPADIEKYLMEYAQEEAPSECVKRAIEIHSSVVGPEYDPSNKEEEVKKKDGRLWQILNEMKVRLANGQTQIPLEEVKQIEEMLSGHDQIQAEDEEVLAELIDARKEYQKIMLRQGTVLATTAETSREMSRDNIEELYLESIEYLESAARVSHVETETKDSVVAVFRKYAAFLAMEMGDSMSAVQVIERAFSLYPDDNNLCDLLKSAKRLA